MTFLRIFFALNAALSLCVGSFSPFGSIFVTLIALSATLKCANNFRFTSSHCSSISVWIMVFSWTAYSRLVLSSSIKHLRLNFFTDSYYGVIGKVIRINSATLVVDRPRHLPILFKGSPFGLEEESILPQYSFLTICSWIISSFATVSVSMFWAFTKLI